MADRGALGLVETRGLVAALEAADAAVKAASVEFVGIKKTVPALMTVQIRGETAAVRSAVDAAKAAAERVGQVVAVHVIPRPDAQVERMQGMSSTGGDSPARSARAVRAHPQADIESMTVRELRALARDREDIGLQGREISRANKAELIKALGR